MQYLVSRSEVESHAGIEMPKISDIRGMLRYNPVKSCREKVLSAYIIGSTAKLSSKQSSDIDIAIIIAPKSRKTAIRFTEEYHESFVEERFCPHWKGKKVDFQFFYSESEISNFPKMELLKKLS